MSILPDRFVVDSPRWQAIDGKKAKASAHFKPSTLLVHHQRHSQPKEKEREGHHTHSAKLTPFPRGVSPSMNTQQSK
jgi:hypothetical protein